MERRRGHHCRRRCARVPRHVRVGPGSLGADRRAAAAGGHADWSGHIPAGRPLHADSSGSHGQPDRGPALCDGRRAAGAAISRPGVRARYRRAAGVRRIVHAGLEAHLHHHRPGDRDDRDGIAADAGVRQRGQPAAGARRRPSRRARGPDRARRVARPRGPAAAHREPVARAARRRSGADDHALAAARAHARHRGARYARRRTRPEGARLPDCGLDRRGHRRRAGTRPPRGRRRCELGPQSGAPRWWGRGAASHALHLRRRAGRSLDRAGGAGGAAHPRDGSGHPRRCWFRRGSGPHGGADVPGRSNRIVRGRGVLRFSDRAARRGSGDHRVGAGDLPTVWRWVARQRLQSGRRPVHDQPQRHQR